MMIVMMMLCRNCTCANECHCYESENILFHNSTFLNVIIISFLISECKGNVLYLLSKLFFPTNVGIFPIDE